MVVVVVAAVVATAAVIDSYDVNRCCVFTPHNHGRCVIGFTVPHKCTTTPGWEIHFYVDDSIPAVDNSTRPAAR